MEDILNRVDWEKQELLPVIVQDIESNEVLMLAYMDKQALELSLKTKTAHYFSRSKQRIWKKGESSGHIQSIHSFNIDCDNDTLLLKVTQEGVACHTGRKSCFFTELESGEVNSEVEVKTDAIYGVVDTLYHTIQERKNADPSESWTAKLLSKGDNTILKKVVEEAGEFSFAYKDNDESEMIYEAADLTYHMLVALASKNISPERIKQELARRFNMSGIAEKIQEKIRTVNMKENINAILDALIVQDYILFASVFILFIVLMILAVVLRAKKNTSRLIVSLAFLILLLGPTLGYIEMHKFLFKNNVELTREQKLEYTKAIVVEGKLENSSKVNFKACKIIATAYRKTPNKYKNYILRLKPIQISSIVIEGIQKNQSKEFKMFIEPFTYTKEYEVGLEASCK